jgi:hypothetical protein
MHEIGHAIHVGKHDDKFWEDVLANGEVYSGSDGSGDALKDDTYEFIDGQNGRGIMRAGYRSRVAFRDQSTACFIFTIEELFTIDTHAE